MYLRSFSPSRRRARSIRLDGDVDQPPRLALAELPTPLMPLNRLSADLGGPRLWIKRDDVMGLGGGGSKVRKLEFLLAAARDAGADLVITSGAVQSNHARLTAAACARLGMPCELWLNRRVPDRPDGYEQTGNTLLNRLLGAHVELVNGDCDADEAAERRAAALRRVGRRPFVIPSGGSSALGARGYVLCAREILAQAERLDADFRAIVVAVGSGGTLAGLAAGLGAAEWTGELIGVSVSTTAQDARAHVERIAGEIGRAAPFMIDDRYLGPGYGLSTRASKDALRRFARTEGILLDPVYTAKAAAALLELAPTLSGDVLFLHTGGTPALFAYDQELD